MSGATPGACRQVRWSCPQLYYRQTIIHFLCKSMSKHYPQRHANRTPCSFDFCAGPRRYEAQVSASSDLIRDTRWTAYCTTIHSYDASYRAATRGGVCGTYTERHRLRKVLVRYHHLCSKSRQPISRSNATYCGCTTMSAPQLTPSAPHLHSSDKCGGCW